jgi:hypothetical protein
MRYPVDYVRHAARLIRKVEGRLRLGEGDEVMKEELLEILKTVTQALDEISNAIDGIQRSRE